MADGAPTTLVGRDRELEAISRLIGTEHGAAAALVLEGAPGLGKTALWEHGLAMARERGMRVLVTRANEAEAALPFAGLIDLLDGVTTDELSTVPAPQRHALDVALYRAEPTKRAPEPAVISLAVLSSIRALASEGPILVAVDDVQWLDPGSGDALAYAARRLRGERVRFLLAKRPTPRSALERALPDDTEQVRLTALSLGATRQLLSARLGLRLPHHLLRHVFETTMGNPLFALEVGRSIAERDPAELGEDLPVPRDVEEMLGLRVADLETGAGTVLLALALDADMRLDKLVELAGAPALDVAVTAGVATVERDRVRAAHPLLAAAAKRQASETTKRDLHRGLADLCIDEERSVLHLALATLQPDDELAERAVRAAALAAARGATRLAVDLADHALRLTPDGRDDTDRVLALAQHLHTAGEKSRLSELLAGRLESLPPGSARVTACLLLTGGVVKGNEDIVALLERGLTEAGEDPVLRARVLCHLAENEAVIQVEQLPRADARAAEALQLSAGSEAEQVACYTLVWTHALRGAPIDELLERSAALSTDQVYLSRRPERVAGQRLVWRGELEQGRSVLEAFRARAEERGEPNPGALARLHLCELALRAGAWAETGRLLDEWAESTDSFLLHWPMYERCRALLAAGRGDAEGARRWADRALELAQARGVQWDWLEASRALGLAAMLDGDPERAAHHLRAVWEHTRREGAHDPGTFPAAPDLVEVLVELESHDEAGDVVVVLQEAAEAQDHPWAGLGAARCRALLKIHLDGYADEAAAELEAAASGYARLGCGFDEARTLLALGRAQRRARKWGASRDVLERAAAAFEALGSAGWAEAARTEQERTGARRSSSDGALTATERRVADLAVSGLSNKEIARTLVVTVNTVEFHLRNTYAKLGIRSRVQLAGRLQELESPPA